MTGGAADTPDRSGIVRAPSLRPSWRQVIWRSIVVTTSDGAAIVNAVRRYKFLLLGSFLEGWSEGEIAAFLPLLERFSAWSDQTDTAPSAIRLEIARLRDGLSRDIAG